MKNLIHKFGTAMACLALCITSLVDDYNKIKAKLSLKLNLTFK